MSTKNDKYSFFEQSRNPSENQYYNLNLNQSKKCPILVPVQSYSKLKNDEYCGKKNAAAVQKKIATLILSLKLKFKIFTWTAATNFIVSKNYKEKEKLQSWNKSFKVSSFKTLNEDNDDLKKRWKIKNTFKTTNKSTLSLHITAYENSIEAAGSDLFAGLKKEKFGSIKTAERCFADYLKSRNPFEFPRQQNDLYESIPAENKGQPPPPPPETPAPAPPPPPPQPPVAPILPPANAAAASPKNNNNRRGGGNNNNNRGKGGGNQQQQQRNVKPQKQPSRRAQPVQKKAPILPPANITAVGPPPPQQAPAAAAANGQPQPPGGNGKMENEMKSGQQPLQQQQQQQSSLQQQSDVSFHFAGVDKEYQEDQTEDPAFDLHNDMEYNDVYAIRVARERRQRKKREQYACLSIIIMVCIGTILTLTSGILVAVDLS